ncbi:DUF4351 domain-containing protein [Candidatus Viridilinea mediisalina]|uniref:DUF4351 domain-containing protein n=1 Tax=Candidatus Viridilinea mediisalina TaxID=2024553 RepID=A0A2A6RIF6_9CHLR|nr:DUF4351 domain-containing protein [Candidatus Viridilinea mediisalina]PDW02723.1 hypothetical protein CJ255_12510 [Candidatus Viridilinea mediisalina]
MESLPSDFDGAWKYAMHHFFPPFTQLFFPLVYAAIDWSKPFHFLTTALEQIDPDRSQGKQHTDTLVQVIRRDGKQSLVFVHIEIQSQYDTEFPERMFRYHARLFDRQRQPVVSLAVLGDERASWHPDHFGYNLWECELTLKFPTVKLIKLDRSMLEASNNPVAALTLIHCDALETRGQPAQRMERKIARFRSCLRKGYSIDDFRKLIRLLDQLLRLDPNTNRQVRATIRQIEQEEQGMDTFVTSFEQLAREEGRAEGREEGRAEILQEVVLRLLKRRCGSLPATLQHQVIQLDSAQLLALSEAVLELNSLDDLHGWLAQQE